MSLIGWKCQQKSQFSACGDSLTQLSFFLEISHTNQIQKNLNKEFE